MKIALTDSKIPLSCERALTLRGFHIIKMPPMRALPSPLSSHPDMLLCHIDGVILTSAEYCDEAAHVFCEIRELLPNIEIRFCNTTQTDKYPNDAVYNALTIGKRLFCRRSSVAPEIIELATERGYEIVDTNQGYPACTTLALNEKIAVSADRGMLSALSSHGICAREIENGDILLPPYEYGFIGGAAGVYGGCAYFLGNLDLHRCANVIKDACLAAGVVPISLSDGELLDLGRIIFLD